MLTISKKQIVKDRLLRLGSITPKEAFIEFGLYRLSSVIHKLRAEGMNIKTTIIRLDDGTTYAKYKLDALPS
jgi:hypothetical protein